MLRHEALPESRGHPLSLAGQGRRGIGVTCRWLPCSGQKDERQGCRVGSDLEALVVILKVQWFVVFFFFLRKR